MESPSRTNINSKKLKKSKIPLSIVSFFLAVLVCFGLDFGFTKLLKIKSLRLLVKSVYVVMFFISIAILALPLTNVDNTTYWYYFYIVQYISHFLILLFTKYTVFNFMNDIHDVIENINGSTKIKHTFGAVLISCTFIIFALKMCICVSTCLISDTECPKSIMPFYIYCISLLGLDAVSVTHLLIFYYIYSSMKYLRKSILKQNTLLKCIEKHYVSISNCCEKVRPLYTRLLIIELVIVLPKLMGLMWRVLFSIKINTIWSHLLYCTFFTCHTIYQICSPSIVAEMINTEVQSFKLILNNKLIMEEDEKKCLEIWNLKSYVKARPVISDVWHVIPLDLRLPATLLSICSTYLIVIIQFTHLYD